MARLARLGVVLPSLAPAVSSMDSTREQARAAVKPSRRWYNTARWRSLRWSVLVEAGFTCARCGFASTAKGALVADHVEPHREDAARFWDRTNLQCLCATCHSRDKQREENAARG